jgi:predicted NBD/HSP70 family sugar kinase
MEILDAAALRRASGPLRAYAIAGRDRERDEAHSILADSILAAAAQGDQEAYGALNEARLLLSQGHSQANDADNMLDALAQTRRK